jgi:hypothetical protein
VASSCEGGDETPGSIKIREFLDQILREKNAQKTKKTDIRSLG